MIIIIQEKNIVYVNKDNVKAISYNREGKGATIMFTDGSKDVLHNVKEIRNTED